MSSTPIGRSEDIQRLVRAGYSVEVRQGHLLLHDVPYVDAGGSVRRGTLVTALSLAGRATTTPTDHVVHFIGSAPCSWTGAPLTGLEHAGSNELAPGLRVDRSFSNKPGNPFPSHEHKLLHYLNLISAHAAEVQPGVSVRTRRPLQDDTDSDAGSVFAYPDSASARNGIQSISDKLVDQRVAIVGMGGTGAHVLDLLAKASVASIDVYDGDELLTHNAFRAPGHVTVEELEVRPRKASYYAARYSQVRSGIVAHDQFVTASNVHLLGASTFVFLCLDSGAARRDIAEYLMRQDIPFVDCGLGLLVNEREQALFGTVRATLVAPGRGAEALPYLSFGGDEPGDDVYASNIQVVELNALNACMAVLRFKQYLGFYVDLRGGAQWTMSTSTNTMAGSAG